MEVWFSQSFTGSVDNALEVCKVKTKRIKSLRVMPVTMYVIESEMTSRGLNL